MSRILFLPCLPYLVTNVCQFHLLNTCGNCWCLSSVSWFLPNTHLKLSTIHLPQYCAIRDLSKIETWWCSLTGKPFKFPIIPTMSSHSLYRTSEMAIPSAWNILPPNIHKSFNIAKMHLWPSLIILYKIASITTPLLALTIPDFPL